MFNPTNEATNPHWHITGVSLILCLLDEHEWVEQFSVMDEEKRWGRGDGVEEMKILSDLSPNKKIIGVKLGEIEFGEKLELGWMSNSTFNGWGEVLFA